MTMISCRNISKTYQAGSFFRPKKKAVRQVSFQVKRGEVFGIVGPNGAGKSTIIKLLMGFIRADQGKAFLNQEQSGTLASHRNLGYLPEHPSLYPHLTPYELLMFSARIADIPPHRIRDKIKTALQRVELEPAAKTPIKQLSKGMTQRAAIAYTLFLDPEILILDEPMSGLDPMGRHLVIDLIREYHAKGTTILFCSHILTDVERICTRIGIMNNGKIAAITTPEELADLYSSPLNHQSSSPLESFFLKTIQADAS